MLQDDLFWALSCLHDQSVPEQALYLRSVCGLQLPFSLLLAHYKVSKILKLAGALKAVAVGSSVLEEALVVVIWSLDLSMSVVLIIEILALVLALVCKLFPA